MREAIGVGGLAEELVEGSLLALTFLRLSISRHFALAILGVPRC